MGDMSYLRTEPCYHDEGSRHLGSLLNSNSSKPALMGNQSTSRHSFLAVSEKKNLLLNDGRHMSNLHVTCYDY